MAIRRLRLSTPGIPAILAALLLSCSGEPSGPATPVALVVLEGHGAAALAGTVLPVGPTFELRDGTGDPVVGATIGLEVLAGGGSLASEAIETDALGQATGIWILGREAGVVQRLRASSAGLSVELTASTFDPAPGERYAGRLDYIEYWPGTLPLVLTAPHGGDLEPEEIPDRPWGTTVRDRNTRELTLAIRDALFSETGAYPHVIISNLHRVKLDPNREIVEAAQGNPAAERAWWEFQVFADEAGNRVEDAFGEGLHLDIHGHAHAIDWVELGYLLSSEDLAESDEILASSEYVNKSSVKALAEKTGNDLPSLIRGPTSLGTLLEDRLVPAVPSAAEPNPGQNEYFTGGYNTVRHGSRDGGRISAIQIEHHFPGLRDEAGNRERYARALVEALTILFEAHFGFDLRDGGGGPLPPA